MEGKIVKAFLFLCVITVVNGKVFTPCELVREIENEKDTNSEHLDFDYEKHISLVVCIAGYRKYDTSYLLAHPNGTGYHGIFGIHNSDYKKCYKPGDWRVNTNIDTMRNEFLNGDLRCLAHIILASKATVDFYEKLCSPPFVRNISCPLNNYAITTVFDPIHKDILELAFATNNDPLTLLKSKFQPTTQPTTETPFAEPPKTSTIDGTRNSTQISGDITFDDMSTPPAEDGHLKMNINVSSLTALQHSPPPSELHWTQRLTVFTCLVVLLVISVFSALKIMIFVEKQKANRNSSLRQEYHFDAESEIMR